MNGKAIIGKKVKAPPKIAAAIKARKLKEAKAKKPVGTLKALPAVKKPKGIYNFDNNRPNNPRVVSVEGGGRMSITGNIQIKVEKGDKYVKMILVDKDFRFENKKDSKKDAKTKKMIKTKFDKLVEGGNMVKSK